MFSTDAAQGNLRLLVFAGPNGSGKSTMTKRVPIVGLYVNADEIKRISGCSDLEAAREAEQIQELLLSQRRDFTFETVLSTARNLELIRRAKKARYEICVVFVLTCDCEINVRRVRERVLAGGHDVSEEKIRSRYVKSMKNLSPLVRIADMTRIIDNSRDDSLLICEVERQTVRIWNNDVWSKTDILNLLAR